MNQVSELRPHLSRDTFVTTVQRLMATPSFSLAYLEEGGIKAVAGYRTSEWLHAGRLNVTAGG